MVNHLKFYANYTVACAWQNRKLYKLFTLSTLINTVLLRVDNSNYCKRNDSGISGILRSFSKLNFNSTPEQQEIGCIFTCFAEPGFDIISLLVKLPVTNSKSTKSTSVDFFKSQQELVRRKTYFKISWDINRLYGGKFVYICCSLQYDWTVNVSVQSVSFWTEESDKQKF